MALLFITTAVALCLIVAFTILELVTPTSRIPLLARLPGFTFAAVGSIAAGLFSIPLRALWASLGIEPLVVVPIKGWAGETAAILASVMLYDFLAYWNHRFQHRYLWPIHATHHSAHDLCAANDFAHFTEGGLRFLLFALPLSLIHFDFPATPLLIAIMVSGLEMYIHTASRLHFGPFRWLFVDNRFHRIHHSLERKHLR